MYIQSVYHYVYMCMYIIHCFLSLSMHVPTQFPSFIHTQKRNPQTHLKVRHDMSDEHMACTYTHLYIHVHFIWTVHMLITLLSQDADMFWDFITLRPESTHQVSFLFSDRGIPDGYRHMNGYGSHTFKLVNRNGEAVYCKFHYKVSPLHCSPFTLRSSQ